MTQTSTDMAPSKSPTKTKQITKKDILAQVKGLGHRYFGLDSFPGTNKDKVKSHLYGMKDYGITTIIKGKKNEDLLWMITEEAMPGIPALKSDVKYVRFGISNK